MTTAAELCAKCGAALQTNDRFCTGCGAPASAAAAAAADPAAGTSLRWKWVPIAVLVIVATQAVFGAGYGLMLGMGGYETEDVNPLTLGLLGLLGFPLGGFLVALRSPGVTIREPAVAGLLSIAVSALLQGAVPNLIAVAIIYGLTILGAKLGEAVQSRRGATVR